MSILDGLIRGASAGVIGAQQGVAARQQLERQALHEAMVQRLQDAQIGHLNAQTYALQNPTAKSDEWETDVERGVQINKRTGEVRQLQGLPPKTPKPKTLTRFTGPDNKEYTFDAETGTVALAKGAQPGPAPDKKSTQAEQSAAAFAGTQKKLRPQIEVLENKGIAPSPGAEFVEGLGNVPIVGGLVKPMTTKGANYLRNEDQQKLRNLARQWMIATLRLDSQGTITNDEFENYYATYFRQPGDNPSIVAQKQAARREKEREADIRAGEPPAGIASPEPTGTNPRTPFSPGGRHFRS